MDLNEFCESLGAATPPPNISLVLQALWYDGKENWQQAHDLIQDEPDRGAALIHAYLHRKEGDIWNADYWYRRAGAKRPQVSLKEEWEQMVSRFLA